MPNKLDADERISGHGYLAVCLHFGKNVFLDHVVAVFAQPSTTNGGMMEAEKLPKARTRGCRETKSFQTASGAKSL